LARAVLTEVAEREGVPEAVRSALALAVTEACANVVLHAYVDADAPGHLEVRACRAGAVLIVEVADDGRGMVPRIDSSGLGLGLPLIAQMADVFEIRTHRQRRGLVLRMQFNLDRTPETSR
jgi:anti-sigma regulatory factor (Ser/Thr protein kinase)